MRRHFKTLAVTVNDNLGGTATIPIPVNTGHY